MGRSTDEKGADKAVQLRRSQQKERVRLQSEIAAEQKTISAISEERAPIAAEVRKVEAEVGPIKYIANFIYGDNPDANVLEKAVTWVIIIIVIVFDPLAVILLLASQYSFQWFRKQEEDSDEDVDNWFADRKERAQELDKEAAEQAEDIPTSSWPQASAFWPFPAMWNREEPKYEADDGPLTDEQIEQIQEEANKDLPTGETITQEQLFENIDDKNALEGWNQMIAEAEKAVEEEKELEDHEILEAAAETEKQAMAAWKHDNPDSSLKFQRRLLEKGAIDKLPWDDYLKAQPDFSDDEAAEEAAKWALEQVENKKKDSELDGDRERTSDQENQRRLEGYVQNAEQGDQTLWQRIKKGS
jgi:hypothetical protein